MKPLDGVRVLEIASIGPGPLAANMFFELGAEVISCLLYTSDAADE